MKITRSIGTAHVCLLACLLSPVALAAEPGIYAGFNLGRATSKIDKTRITDELFAPGFTYTSRRSDTKDFGFKLFGGYQFTPYFSLEAGYFDLGSYNLDTAILPSGVLLSDMGIRGINFDAVVTLPVTDKMSVFARAGMNKIELDSDFYGSGSAAGGVYPSGSRRDTHEKFGVGMQFELSEKVSVRVEAERYNLADVIRRDGNVNLYSAGLVYSFAKSKPAPVAVVAPRPTPAPAPAPVAAPTPPPAPAPAPVVTTMSADSFFAFDSDVLLPAGQRELDTLATSLRGTDYDVISVTGHTDRLGRPAYNLALSTRRAEAVKAYLVTRGVPAAKVTARGVNGSNPVTTMAACPGTVATPALIACLQPDRRVEVEVTARR